MRITDALLGEHAVLYDLFATLRDIAGRGGEIAEIRGAILVLERLLVAHARVEEELLFPALEPHLGQIGPLMVMRAEHRGIDDLLEAARVESDPSALRATITELLDLAAGHFAKEERALFPMARRFLDEATLTALGDRWAQRRAVAVDAAGCGG